MKTYKERGKRSRKRGGIRGWGGGGAKSTHKIFIPIPLYSKIDTANSIDRNAITTCHKLQQLPNLQIIKLPYNQPEPLHEFFFRRTILVCGCLFEFDYVNRLGAFDEIFE